MKLFLTGARQVGKSTLLRKLLFKSGLRPGGLMTDFGPRRQEAERSLYLLPYGEAPRYAPEAVCARFAQGHRQPLPEVFDQRGAALLKRAQRDPDVDIIVIDELGFLEADALRFRQTVLELLAGAKPVCGVVRWGCSLWQDAPLGESVAVTLQNRDELAELLCLREIR